MKRTLLSNNVFLMLFSLFVALVSTNNLSAQSDFYNVISGSSTSANGRAPQAARNISRSVYLLTATEIGNAGLVTSDVLNGIGFTYSTASDVATSGNITIYMQNTADVTNTKSTTYATAITGMTTVSNGAITIPNVTGDFNYSFIGGSPFTYTGGGIYIAFDYQNLANPVGTVTNIALCNTSLANGLLGAISAAGSTTPPATLTVSAFRPQTRLAKAVSCTRPTTLNANFTAATLTSATLTWNPIGGANVDIEYGPYGFTQGSGSSFTNVTQPYLASGLTNSSVYQYYVRTNCGTSYSAWAGPYPFTTVHTTVSAPYTTSFEQEVLPFIGWSIPNSPAIAGDWAIARYGAGSLVQDGVASVVSITPAAAAANNWMFSKGIELTIGSTVTVSYYASNYQSSTTKLGDYELKVGNAANVAAQTTSITNEVGLTGAPFVLKTFNFTTTFTGAHYFGFQNKTTANATGTHAVIIDNFTVTETLSTNDILNTKLSVYPNPVNNMVNVSNSLNVLMNSVSITDINGRVVKNVVLSNVSDAQINVAELNTGVYFLKIETNEGTATKKIVKN